VEYFTRQALLDFNAPACKFSMIKEHKNGFATSGLVFIVKTKPRFGECIPVLGVKPKLGWYVFLLFFKIGLCSAISFKRSRRELSIDVAEHRFMSKN